MRDIGRRAKAAARVLALASTAQKDRALAGMAAAIRASKSEILAANAEDLADGKTAGLTAAALDRLTLERPARRGDGRRPRRGARPRRSGRPGHRILDAAERHDHRARARCRSASSASSTRAGPNVTADAGALTLKAGNAVILRGGSDSHRSSRAIHAALAKGLREANLPEAAISLVPTRDRAAVGMMLRRPRRQYRRHRAARRQEPGRARADRSAGAGVRASRRRLPCLCRQGRRSRHGQDHRDERQAAAHRRLRRGRDAAGRSRRARRRISSR